MWELKWKVRGSKCYVNYDDECNYPTSDDAVDGMSCLLDIHGIYVRFKLKYVPV